MRALNFFNKKSLSVSFLPNEKPSGLIVPLITPLNSDKSIDTLALKAITARLMNKGVKNFFVFNSFSEYEYLSFEQKKEVLTVVHKEVDGKGFLIVGCFGSTNDEIITNVLEAQKYTNLCVVNVPLPALEKELDFIDFFDSLFTQTSANILLYNNSISFKKSIPALWLDNIINWERLVGVIDYSRNPEYLDELGKYYQLTKLFEENEELAFDALRRNFSGVSCLASIAFPAYYLSLINDFGEIDFSRMVRQEARISAMLKMLPQNKKIQAFKHAFSLQRLTQPYFSDALDSLTEKEVHLVEQAFGLKSEIKSH
ncbi:MAG: dihydrodipicolinate synthase family protein [archaeon]|jgi:4-hydroxy-tetrahydrodipicolinate synthase